MTSIHNSRMGQFLRAGEVTQGDMGSEGLVSVAIAHIWGELSTCVESLYEGFDIE